MESELITLKDGRAVHLRGSTQGDGPAVLAYITALGLSTEFILSHADDLPTLEQVDGHIEMIPQGKFYSLVAIDPDSGGVVGNASYRFSPRVKMSHVGDLGIGVLPDWQGSGLGSLLLARSIEDMRAKPGIVRLELTVMNGNDRALRMYDRAGFVVEGHKNRSMRQPDGSYADEILMGLWIGD